MSDSPLLSKMDALLKKHRGGSEDVRDTSPAPSPSSTRARRTTQAWLPVLTEVIERGTPPVVPVADVPEAAASAAPASPPVEPEAPAPVAAALRRRATP